MDGLLADGYAVVRAFDDPDSLSERFRGILQTMIDTEITRPPYAVGGFSALGNAYSFHHPGVRRLRAEVMARMSPLLRAVHPRHRLALGVDRLTFRPAGVASGAENWHRDLTPAHMCSTDDFIYGGWLNTNAVESHTFCCVPGTHAEVDNHTVGRGFSTFSPTEARARGFAESKTLVDIPPGHLIVFDQRLVHCIRGKKLPFALQRMHTSFHLTKGDEPVIKNLADLFARGAVVPLKSGQVPRMWPRAYACNWPDKLVGASEAFPDRMKRACVLRGGNNALPPGKYRVLQPVCPSMHEMGLDFPPYTEEEIGLHFPH